MPKYYCDYCDTFLTHDSPSVRKTHCTGRKHKDNVKFYYQKWMEEQAQHLIDATTAAFKGKYNFRFLFSWTDVNFFIKKHSKLGKSQVILSLNHHRLECRQDLAWLQGSILCFHHQPLWPLDHQVLHQLDLLHQIFQCHLMQCDLWNNLDHF